MSQYHGLPTITDPAAQKVVKALMDRIALLESQAKTIGTVSKPLTAPLHGGNQQIKNLADPAAPQDVVTLAYLQHYVATQVSKLTAPASAAVSPPGSPPPPPHTGICMTDLTKGQPNGVPAPPSLRWFRANSFGVHVPGLPAVIGSAADPTLCLSWFYNRYTNPSDRANILAAHQARGLTHFKLSWPDARVTGCDIPTYVALSQEVAAAGFYVGHFLCGKGNDPADTNAIINGVTPVIQALQAAGGNLIPWACVGWELTLWLTSAQIQTLINAFATLLVPATNLYVHFQPGYMSDGRPGGVAGFWIPQVGKLTGVLFQDYSPATDCVAHQGRLFDVLERTAGNDNMPTDSGFGHPFDAVDYEVTSVLQFSGAITEAQGDAAGFEGICTPAHTGPGGTIGQIMGYGNGCITRAGNRV